MSRQVLASSKVSHLLRRAWQHLFCVNLRTQLSKAGSSLKVIEIVPPTVETELHRDRQDPDDNKKHKGAPALTIEEFMESVGEGWEGDNDVIAPGMAKGVIDKWDRAMGADYLEKTE